MEVVCKSDYQDIYRVSSGVLLVVNKFKYDNRIRANLKYSKRYANGCEEQLRSMIYGTYDFYYGKKWEAGQVFYYGSPVELVEKKDWQYQIKTSGTSFSGNSNEMLSMIDDIKKTIEESGEQNVCKD